MSKNKEKEALEDLFSETLGLDKKASLPEDKLAEVELPVVPAKIIRQGVITGGTPESTKLKRKMLIKKEAPVKEKIPEHIRKVYIEINDKSKNEPITVKFGGEWTGSDLNLAGKHLILEYNMYVRNRSIVIRK